MKLFTYKKKLSRGQTFSLRKKLKVKMAFTWVYLDNDGNPVENLPKEAVIEEFQTRAEAEDWLTVNRSEEHTSELPVTPISRMPSSA